jgi:Tfp pilus assembly major pilin PilA
MVAQQRGPPTICSPIIHLFADQSAEPTLHGSSCIRKQCIERVTELNLTRCEPSTAAFAGQPVAGEATAHAANDAAYRNDGRQQWRIHIWPQLEHTLQWGQCSSLS